MDSGMSRRLHIVDVFTEVPFLGNPVGVVLDGEGLTTDEMQRIANWTNLSETTFVLPSPANIFDSEGRAADYALRIFTPRAELPFAGHPTIGSAHAVLDAGIATPTDGMLIQHCAKGLIAITVPADCERSGISFRLPAHRLTPAPDPDMLHRAFGAAAPFARPPAIVDVGPRWLIAEYPDEASVRSLQPDLQLLADYDRRHGTTGATIFAEVTGGAVDDDSSHSGLVVRSFAPADGIAEDPVCGSGNGAVAAYRLDHGAAGVGDGYTASQGREVGRNGLVQIFYGSDGIHVGGRTVTCVTGHIR